MTLTKVIAGAICQGAKEASFSYWAFPSVRDGCMDINCPPPEGCITHARMPRGVLWLSRDAESEKSPGQVVRGRVCSRMWGKVLSCCIYPELVEAWVEVAGIRRGANGYKWDTGGVWYNQKPLSVVSTSWEIHSKDPIAEPRWGKPIGLDQADG